MTLAIVSAMPEEQAALLARLQAHRRERHAGRDWHHGRLAGRDVVLVLSGIGKVAAAITATLLLQRHGATALLFTGVAGGIGAGVRVGDVVVGTGFLQHDLDASPIFPRWELPGRGVSRLAADAAWSRRLADAVRREHGEPLEGLIVSGDRFVSSVAESTRLQRELPEALAVDMESAAVAQVCLDFGVPLAVVRAVSDRADDDAHVDFPRFLNEVAAPLAARIVESALSAP